MLCHREVRRLPHSPDRDVTSACASLDKKKRTATAGAKLVSGAKIDTDVYMHIIHTFPVIVVPARGTLFSFEVLAAKAPVGL